MLSANHPFASSGGAVQRRHDGGRLRAKGSHVFSEGEVGGSEGPPPR